MVRKCKIDGCNKHPSYGLKGGVAEYCRSHKAVEMVDVCHKFCEFTDCKLRASISNAETGKHFCATHGSEKKKKERVISKICESDGCKSIGPTFDIKGGVGRLCKTHKLPGMINIKYACIQEGCSIRAEFNVLGEKPKYCNIHKKDNMIKLINNWVCETEGCDKEPRYNIKGEKKGRFCQIHKTSSMINIYIKVCEGEGCETSAGFNIPGEKIGKYCSKHKKPDMIDIGKKTCYDSDCNISPCYNYKGESSGKYCKKHKLEGMIDLAHPCCKEDKCSVRPSYGMANNQAEYCFTHKKEGMVNLIKRECEEQDCKNTPNFNKEGETIGRCCSKHKKDGMVDVRHKRCDHEGCKLQPGYTDKKTKKRYCSTHKTQDSISKIRRCEAEGCSIIPTFAKVGEISALRCSTHKETDDVDIKHKFCKTHLCPVRGIDIYDGHCLRCYVNIYPDKPNSRNYKTKESAVSKFIKESFPDVSFISDKQIADGCSKRRPDDIADFGTHCIIIETDEKKHSAYECSCENKRIMEISRDVGHRPIVFLRFNPDAYIDEKGNRITSCWGIDGRGMAAVKKIKLKEWKERLSALQSQIQYWIDNVPGKMVEIIQLCYDGWKND
jgi:hypothetical protein